MTTKLNALKGMKTTWIIYIFENIGIYHFHKKNQTIYYTNVQNVQYKMFKKTIVHELFIKNVKFIKEHIHTYNYFTWSYR